MRIVETIAEMRRACRQARALDAGAEVALVPTMGALHAGHISLVRTARAAAQIVVASIFVNPTQFAPGEDLARYPRSFAEDCAQLEREGVDLVFAPSLDAMYPTGVEGTFVEVKGIGDRLDGASRPGHFRGVATVVAKLFHIVTPDLAFFGQKDAAQVAVLRAMVRDLDMGVELRVCPTVRDEDGLALSSRNRYLSAEERRSALALPAALQCAQALLLQGIFERDRLRAAMIEEMRGLKIDYVEVVSAATLQPLSNACEGALLAVAAWAGNTRLIDNVPIERMR